MQRAARLDCECKQGGHDRTPTLIRINVSAPLTGGPSHGSCGRVRSGVDYASEAFGFVRAGHRREAMVGPCIRCR